MSEGQATPAASLDPVPSGAAAAASPPPLRATLRRGTLWSLAGYGGTQALRFLGNVVLARLLFPEAFGLMALVNALLVGLQLFSDIGIGPSIIQNKRGDDPDFLNTAWTLQILRGFALWGAACVAAEPFAAFYGDPRLAWIVPVAGLSALIAGFNSTKRFSMYRDVSLGRVSMIELSAQAAGAAVMIAWALVDRSVAALVAGGLTGPAVRLVLTHVALPGVRNRLRWDKAAVGQVYRFGRWIFLSTVLTFLVGQADRLVFGKMVPMAMLGVFGMGALIATMPNEVLASISSSVLFPVFSRVRNAGQELASVFDRVRRPLLVLTGWMVSGLIAGGDVAVRLIYDERYVEAGWIVQLLSFGTWFAVLEATHGAALLACGQSKWTAASGAGKLAGMILLIPIGFRLAGFPGAVAGLAAAETVRYGVSAAGVGRQGLTSWPRDARLTLWMLATAGATWALSGLGRERGLPDLALAAGVFALVSVLWVPAAVASLRARAAVGAAGS